jgi:PAS domain-containing protein
MLFYSIGLELMILLTFWVCLGVWQKDHSMPGRWTFVGLCVAMILWCAGDLARVRELTDDFISDRLLYAGVLSVGPLWVGVAAQSTGLPLARRMPWFPLALWLPNLFLFGLLFAGPWSALYVQTRPGGSDIVGPLWWVGVFYGYVLVLAGCALFITSAIRWPTPGRLRRRFAVGVAPLVPLLGNASWVFQWVAWPTDPTPLLLSVTLFALGSALFSGGLFQALPITQHDLLEQLPIGVVLTDRSGVVIDVNPAAERRLGIAEATAVGRALDAILSEAREDVNAEISPVFSNGREAGQLVLIDPPAKPG